MRMVLGGKVTPYLYIRGFGGVAVKYLLLGYLLYAFGISSIRFIGTLFLLLRNILFV